MGNLLTSAEEDRTFNKEVENEKVVKIEKMSVPTDSAKGWFSHEGVKATTESGNVYMIHKVGKPNNDHESATAVHDWSTLRTDDWRSTGHTASVEDRNVKVGHFVEESGTGYSLPFDNCQGAADRMMDLSRPKWMRDLEWMDKHT